MILYHRAGHQQIGPFAPSWVPRWSYLISVVQVHTTTHCKIYTEQLSPTPPKADLLHPITNSLSKMCWFLTQVCLVRFSSEGRYKVGRVSRFCSYVTLLYMVYRVYMGKLVSFFYFKIF